MKIVLVGKVASIKEKSFEGKTSYLYQFLNENDKGLNIVDVKSDSFDSTVAVGDDVVIELSISTYNNKVYYKALNLMKGGLKNA